MNLISTVVVEPDKDCSFLGDGHGVVPVGTVLDSGDRARLGSSDGAQASLFVFPDLDKAIASVGRNKNNFQYLYTRISLTV